jgi:hypothetical protein
MDAEKFLNKVNTKRYGRWSAIALAIAAKTAD